jgi:hypothetical protein
MAGDWMVGFLYPSFWIKGYQHIEQEIPKIAWQVGLFNDFIDD